MISEVETPAEIALISSKKSFRLNRKGKLCRRFAGRNEVCPECDSGKKYKHCCKVYRIKVLKNE